MKLDHSRLSIGLACHLPSAELVFQPEGSRSSGLSADAAVLAAFLRLSAATAMSSDFKTKQGLGTSPGSGSLIAQDFDFTEIPGILTEIMY
jgi:hypothetical protein